jgi:hypothetical protein
MQQAGDSTSHPNPSLRYPSRDAGEVVEDHRNIDGGEDQPMT